eukprot:TRINITY_DN91566_c0_g1_i1.p1 TRINITY_DN91566_c0_g1~~TRINITY_DN91566_c0_g1_i1.p1  ORF type:complete len:713 (-),score=117.58 TRINITY_DN91566_c0_g1_i1:79-2217(-)
MDPTSAEESTPWDPITGKLRAHSGLKLAKGTRDALAKHTRGFDDTRGFSGVSTRCPTTGATSLAASEPVTPRSLADIEDRTQPLRGQMRGNASTPKLPKIRGDSTTPPGRSVRFSMEQPRSASRVRQNSWSPSMSRPSASAAMRAEPGRYDVDPSKSATMRSTAPPQWGKDSGSPSFRGNLPAAMRDDPARYDVAPRGSTEARKYEAESAHLMHMKADPRNDLLNDGSGHNVDGDAQTMFGIEIKKRFMDMKSAFLKIDTDFDGRITLVELMEACHQWGIPLSEAKRVMNSVDEDDKGYIDFDEFARRFDPVLEVSADDDEILRLYQAGVMGDEKPISLAGVRHGTTTADPLSDEAGDYRTENKDLRGRLARAMRRVSDLESDLKASRAHAASLQVSLDDANARNLELHDDNRLLRRKLEQAEDDKRRAEDRERRLERLVEEANRLRGLRAEEDDDLLRRRRQRELDEAEEEERRRRARERDLERELAEANARRRQEEEEDESGTVFVYGLEGCDKTDAMFKALDKAKVPYKIRDFNKDKRFMKALQKHEDYNGSSVYAPVVCLGGKVWWRKDEDYEMIPFPTGVAMDLRRELGLHIPKKEPVREDVDIDTEIYQRFLSMQDAFLKLDDNRDGFVTEDELIVRCREWNIPTSEASRIIAEADKDAKGAIDFNEFAKRFDSLFNRACRGPLRGLSPMPHQPNKPRPKTSPPAA